MTGGAVINPDGRNVFIKKHEKPISLWTFSLRNNEFKANAMQYDN